MLAEDHEGTQPLCDLEAAVRLDEVTISGAGWQALQGSRRIHSPARKGDRLTVDIRREDPDLRPRTILSQGFGDDDCERVCLLAGRATGRPEPELPLLAPGFGDQLGQDVVAQVLEQLGVPEELRDLDQEAVDEPGVLLGVGLQVRAVLGERRPRRGGHPAVQPALDGGRLVAAEVDAASLVDPFEEAAELLVIGPFRRRIAGREEIAQGRSDRVEIGRRVNQGRRDRAGHRREHCRLRVLDDDRTARLLYVPGADRSIGPAAGQDDGDEPGAEDTGRTLQQHVDGGCDRAGPGRVELELSLADIHEAIRRNDEDHPVLEGLPLLDHPDRERRVAGQNLVKVAGAARVEMLRDHDRRREVGRQARHEASERLDAARR